MAPSAAAAAALISRVSGVLETRHMEDLVPNLDVDITNIKKIMVSLTLTPVASGVLLDSIRELQAWREELMDAATSSNLAEELYNRINAIFLTHDAKLQGGDYASDGEKKLHALIYRASQAALQKIGEEFGDQEDSAAKTWDTLRARFSELNGDDREARATLKRDVVALFEKVKEHQWRDVSARLRLMKFHAPQWIAKLLHEFSREHPDAADYIYLG